MVGARGWRPALSRWVINAGLAVTALVCIAPVVHTAALSFSEQAAAAAGGVTFWPVRFSLASYQKLLGDLQFFRSFAISVIRVLLGCSINFALTVLMAFPLSREPRAFRARNLYAWACVFTMLFNGGLIPWYMTIAKLGIIDTIWALVLPGAVPVFNVILLMNFFRNTPKELEEAAIVDGAGPWQVLASIFLPVSLPALATVTLFSVVWHWNMFFDGLILINRSANYPLQTYIQTLLVDISFINLKDPKDLERMMRISNRTLNAAKIVVSMIPILAVYPFLQRYFIHGIVLGAVKE